MLILIGQRRVAVKFHLGWVLALFCLACASQCIPLPGTNVSWLPLLPVMTAGTMAAIKPRALGLLGTGALCLVSYLAIRRIVPDWDASSQVGLLISFVSTYGFWAIIRVLSAARAALEGSSCQLFLGQASGTPIAFEQRPKGERLDGGHKAGHLP